MEYSLYLCCAVPIKTLVVWISYQIMLTEELLIFLILLCSSTVQSFFIPYECRKVNIEVEVMMDDRTQASSDFALKI